MNEIELKNINDTQNEYENILVSKLLKENSILKTINFSSPTGTGKTKMMAEVINKMSSDYFFMITTLSRGQLNTQIRKEIARHTSKNNYIVFGLNDYTKNTHLQANDILSIIPKDKKVIWFRDEGHINTNRWFEILEKLSYKIVNFSATNKYNSDDDINCNFNHTMMLRTVFQSEGTPADALKKLMEVKEEHKNVSNYNPCAILRILDEDILKSAIKECVKRKLKYINITDENYDMSELCMDDNEYDVIINKFKITEGIDIRRAHVLYMTNEPSNPATTIQVIGRCRRNALLYRDDIDILAPKNCKLLENTRKCYVFYNVQGMNIDEDESGNLVMAFCPIISVQSLRNGITIHLKKGVLSNGLTVLEANGESGIFEVLMDEQIGFNILNPLTSFYIDNKKKNYKYIVYSKKLLSNINYFIYEITEEMRTDKVFYLDEYIYDDYLLTENKSKELIHYLNNNPISVEDKIKVHTYADGKSRKYKYWVDTYELIGPTTDFDEELDFENMSIAEIAEKCYKLEPSSYVKRFLTKNEAVEYANKIKNEKIRYNIPLYWYRDRCINLSSNKRLRFKHLYVFDKKSAYNKFMEVNGDYTYYTVKKCVNLGDVKSSDINDREIALMAGDMKATKRFGRSTYLKTEYEWEEDMNVTSKLSKYTKFNIYISNKYKNILEHVEKYLYTYSNNIFDTKKFNSMFGFCVEYTTKLLFEYDKTDLTYIRALVDRQAENYKIEAENYFNDKRIRALIVRCAIKEYQQTMKQVFNLPATKIPSISYEKLINEEDFLEKIFKYSKQTFRFFMSYFNLNLGDKKQNAAFFKSMSKCDLSVRHISGLADFIIGDTIIDLKCTSSINEKYIKQVLAYYWLSQKHKLGIKKVMVYEAIKNKYILIDLEKDSIDTNIE